MLFSPRALPTRQNFRNPNFTPIHILSKRLNKLPESLLIEKSKLCSGIYRISKNEDGIPYAPR
jgi:hypothetical protein